MHQLASLAEQADEVEAFPHYGEANTVIILCFRSSACKYPGSRPSRVYYYFTHPSLPISTDAGGLQVGTNLEARAESATCDAAAVCPQTAEVPNTLLRPTVAQIQHENVVRHLSESATSSDGRLGLRKR